MKRISKYFVLALMAGVEGHSFEISVRSGEGQDIVLEWASDRALFVRFGGLKTGGRDTGTVWDGDADPWL